MHPEACRYRRRRPFLALSSSLCLVLSAFAGLVTTGELLAAEPQVRDRQEAALTGPDPALRAFAYGSFQEMKGDHWGAIETFRKISPAAPVDAAAVEYSISKAFSSLSVADSARVHGESAVSLDPGNIHYARHAARLAHGMQDYQRAAELYGQAAGAAPDRTDLLYSQGLEYVAAGRPSEALEVFEKLLKRDPLDEKAISQTLWLQITLKRYPEAIVTLNQLAGVVGNSQKLQLTLGQLYDLTGNGEKAVDTFKGIIAEERNAVPAWVALFDQRIRMGNHDDLLREYLEFDSLTPRDAGRSVEVARLFAARSERDSLYLRPVTLMLDELTLRYSRDARIPLLRGAFQMIHQKYGDAVSAFNRALLLEHRDVDAWEGLSMAYLELQDKRMLFRTIARAKQAIPRQRDRLAVLEGYALLHTGSPSRAARILEMAVGREAGSLNEELLIKANTSLAMAYDRLGRRQLSGKAYARVLELDPHNVLAMNNLAYLYAEAGIRLQQALRLARNAVLLEPDNGVYLDTLGWVLCRLGNYDAARDMLEKAVATGIGESEIFTHLGMVYQKLGDAEKAGEMFDKAKSVKMK